MFNCEITILRRVAVKTIIQKWSSSYQYIFIKFLPPKEKMAYAICALYKLNCKFTNTVIEYSLIHILHTLVFMHTNNFKNFKIAKSINILINKIAQFTLLSQNMHTVPWITLGFQNLWHFSSWGTHYNSFFNPFHWGAKLSFSRNLYSLILPPFTLNLIITHLWFKLNN